MLYVYLKLDDPSTDDNYKISAFNYQMNFKFVLAKTTHPDHALADKFVSLYVCSDQTNNLLILAVPPTDSTSVDCNVFNHAATRNYYKNGNSHDHAMSTGSIHYPLDFSVSRCVGIHQ